MKYMIRLTSLTALFLALMSGAALFWVSQQVQQIEREQRQLLTSNTQEEESIRVLKVEWDYLNRPERLEELANKYLNMAPASADTMIQSISAIPEPEDPSLAPEEKPVEISTAPSVKKSEAPIAQMAPPVLNENDKQEDQFGKVLDNVGATGQ